MSKPDGRTSVSATVVPAVKAAVVERAEAEDRLESAVVRRALDVYLAMSLRDAEEAVAEARNGKPPEG